MQTKAKHGCIVGTVVENQFGVDRRAVFESLYETPVKSTLVAQLNPFGSTIDGSGKAILDGMPILRKQSGIQDWIDGHYSCMGAWLSLSAQAEILRRRQTQQRPSEEFGATSLWQTTHFTGAGSGSISIVVPALTGFLMNFSAKLIAYRSADHKCGI